MSFGFPSIVYCKDLFPFRKLDDPIQKCYQIPKQSAPKIGCFSRPPHHPPPPPQVPLPLKGTPLSPAGAFTSGPWCFSPQRKIADAFGDKFGNGIMALSAFLGGFACAFGLGSLAHHPWMDGWMAPAGVGMGWLQPEFDGIYHHPLPRNKLRKLIVSIGKVESKPFFLFWGWGGVLS